MDGVEPRCAATMRRLAERASLARTPADAREMLSDVRSFFAGMGSLSDLVLQDRSGALPAQADPDRLRRELYDEARAGR